MEATKLWDHALGAKTYDIQDLIYKALILEKDGRSEDATEIFEYVTSLENKVKNKGLFKVANFKKNALKVVNSRKGTFEGKNQNKEVDVLNIVVNAFLFKREDLIKAINLKESRFKNYVDSKSNIPKGFPSFLSVLRKWNSYTPIIPSNKNNSKGGGYFLYHCGKGIVIDPGFNFVENFYDQGFKVVDIDAVLVTHAHNDHTVDLESILTLVYKYNATIEKTVRKEMKGENEDKILEEIKKRLKEEGKKIDLFVNLGTFMKYSGWLKIKDSNEINNITVLMPNERYELPKKYHGITIFTAKAKHDEIISNQYAIGFILDIAGVNKIGFTGDSGWDCDRVMVEPFKEKHPELMIAHLGSIKSKEFLYVDPDCEAERERCFYSQHLGLLGITKFLDETKPKLAIISEFGEELKSMRTEISDILSDVLKPVKCLPGDIGLHIRLKDLGIFCFIEEDFINYDKIKVSLAPRDDSILCYHNDIINYSSPIDKYNKAYKKRSGICFALQKIVKQ